MGIPRALRILLNYRQVYLPRKWGSNHGEAPAQVMVGRPPPREAELAAQSLMSLLREGGQWDDDDLRAGRLGTESKAFESPDLMIKRSRWDEGHPLPRVHEVSHVRPAAEREVLMHIL